LAACFGFNDSTKGDLPLAKVDLERMYVGWYIVATIPNLLERGVVGSYDVFSSGEKPGWLREDFYMQRGGFSGPKNHLVGRIQVLPESNNADWRVRPIWPLSLPFKVVYVDPEYRYVLFGEQDRSWGWIYSRTQTISDVEYAALMAKFRALGWDTSLFRKVVQTPDHVGAPGFWSDGVTGWSQ
jgi:apolipoprotein D and lipocalin family protein